MSEKYDVFISYSGEDRDWVETVLVPRLKNAGLKVITQSKFQLGAPVVRNMDDAIARSRYTILVLTPDYLASNFTSYELHVARMKSLSGGNYTVIPILLRPCPELPIGLQGFTYAEFFHPDTQDVEMQRLVDAIPPADTLPTPVREVERTLSAETAASMRRALDTSRRLFKETAEKIVLLDDLKHFHDLLHQLQGWYDSIASSLHAGVNEDILLDLLVDADRLEAIAADMLEATESSAVDPEILLWIEDVTHSHTTLSLAIAKADPRPLDLVNRTIDRILAVQPSVLNGLMTEVVRELSLDDLRSRVQNVLDVAGEEGAPEENVRRLAMSLRILESMVVHVVELVKMHGVWQVADNELRLAEKSLRAGIEELLDDWSRVKLRIERVLRQGEEWTSDMAEGRDQVDKAISIGNPPAIKRAVKRLRGDGKRWFMKLDTRLHHECKELRSVSTYLQMLESSAS